MLNGIRTLASIMFTDIVGYTALMQENEKNAKEIRDKHRRVLEECIEKHQGSILQYYGDGTLSVFGSVIESAICAISIQKELSKDPVIPLRIGIHSGDIVYEDQGVYGDGVNIASRLEALSLPGSVLVSGKVYDELKNQPDIKAVFLGQYKLKNVFSPVDVYALDAPGLKVPTIEDIEEKAGKFEKSIAVLPFVNMSSDAENEYFSDGITEELLNSLAKTKGLRVIARTSSFAFKNKNLDIRDIGKQLNVNTVLEGSVRKAGNKVRITAQLINTNDGFHLWSEVFDRSLEDIFAVQDEIASTIAVTLQEKLNPKKQEPEKDPKKVNLEAYQVFLKGKYFINKWTPNEINKALKLFEDSVQIDPDFAMAHAWIANCYITLSAYGMMSDEMAYSKSQTHAYKALELDDSIEDPYVSIALMKMFQEWDWPESEKNFKKAIEINPNNAEVLSAYSIFLSVTGRIQEAVGVAEEAYSLDPLSLKVNLALAERYYYIERYQDALDYYDKVKMIDPTNQHADRGKIWALTGMGRHEEAVDLLEKNKEDILQSQFCESQFGYILAMAGRMDEAREYLKELKKKDTYGEDTKPEDSSLGFDLSIIYTGLGEYDLAVRYLERAFETRIGGVLFIFAQPGWRALIDTPGYKELMDKLKIVPDFDYKKPKS